MDHHLNEEIIRNVIIEIITTQGQLPFQGTFGVWTDVKVLGTKAVEGEVGMWDQKCPFKGQLSLTGYAQSFVPGELIFIKAAALIMIINIKIH